MIREDRELLAELARAQYGHGAIGVRRLITAGERLQRRADGMSEAVVEGEVLITGPRALPAHTVAPHQES